MSTEIAEEQIRSEVDINVEEYREVFEKSQEEWEPLIQNYLPDFQDYFLSPDNFELIQKLLLDNYPRNIQDRLLDWEMEDMKQILGKIMIFDSVRPTYDNAVELADRLKISEKPNLEVLELCTGAGSSTMMTWKEIKRAFPEKACKLITVDVALESTIIAETLLKLKKIPVIRAGSLNEIPENYDGVIILNLEASDTVQKFVEAGKHFDAVVSDHGIGYFERDVHEQTVKNITDSLLEEGGILSVCSLENDIKVSLAYLQMIKEILFNKKLIDRIPNKETPYLLDERQETVYVRAINSKDSAGLYQILQVLFYDGRIADFIGYIKSISKVAKVTKTLSKEVKSPIRFSQSLLPESEVEPSFNGQKYSIARTLWYQK